MTRTDLTRTSQDGARHATLRPDWYLSGNLENECRPVKRRGLARALMRAIKGVNEHLRARRARSPGAGVDRPGSVVPRRVP
jgi:hypothetical protein